MIRYSLICENSHQFDGWFRNSEDFDKQSARALVTCPYCGSVHVQKSLMAPSVSTARSQEKTALVSAAEASQGEQASAPAVSPAPEVSQPASSQSGEGAMALSGNDYQKAIAEGLRELRKKVLETSDYVGKDFAEEARKIHYGEADARNIHGETSAEDAKALLEEGVSILPLPALPEEKN